jgi:hypothetical protein
MSTELQQELDAAQACIYTRSNIRRAFPDFDDTDVCGIYISGDDCLVVYRDGVERSFPRQPIKDAYTSFTHRLPDFFSYLGPNYRGPTAWRKNVYVMFKGWSYVHALGKHTPHALMQGRWADKFIHIEDEQQLKAIIQSDQADIGYLVAPDGMRLEDRPIDLDSELVDEQDDRAVYSEPQCSCGSFQRQLNNLSLFQKEIKDYRPWCKHLSWFRNYRELLCKRTEIRNACPAYAPDKCVAWWYAPPENSTDNGRFLLLYTKHGAQAPFSHWRNYRPKEVFTQHDAWDLFFNMMDAGYVPFPGTSLPQLTRNKKDGKR